jgi:hypothetical protein
MKNAKFFAYLLIVISTSLFVRCTPENLDYGSGTKEMITGKQWSVDYYFAGQDRTVQFSNYKFSFVGNGTLTANDGIASVNGNWSMITDVNRNAVLRINISEAHLQGLNEQWTVDLSSDVLILKGSGSEMRLRKL